MPPRRRVTARDISDGARQSTPEQALRRARATSGGARRRFLNSTAQQALNRGRAARGRRPLTGRVAVGSARSRSGGS